MRTLVELAQVLERARQERKLSYEELARATGLTPLATRRALQARTAPRVTTLMALAERLGLEVVLVPQVVAQGLTSAPEADRRPLSTVEKLVAGDAVAAPPRGAMAPKGLPHDPQLDTAATVPAKGAMGGKGPREPR